MAWARRSWAASFSLICVACACSKPAEVSAPPPAVAPVATPDAGAVPPSADAGTTVVVPAPPVLKGGLIATGREFQSFITGPVLANGRIGHVIALRDIDQLTLETQLDVIAIDPPVTTTVAPKQTVDIPSLKLAPAAPEALLYVDSIDRTRGGGTLTYVDLEKAKPEAVAVPGGVDVPREGVFFGANGRQVLFLAHYDSTARGEWFWSNGSDKPVSLGANGPLRAAIFNRDRTKAVIGINADIESQSGDLVQVDMATGKATLIDKRVVLTAKAYAPTNWNLRVATELAFSMNAAGTVAYAAGIRIRTWFDGKVTEIAPGRFPSLSDDGKHIAYFAGLSFFVSDATPNAKPLLSKKSAGSLQALWSPDSQYVAFMTESKWKGTNVIFGSVLGDISIFHLGSSGAMPWATDAAWRSATFLPATGKTTHFAVMGDVRDISNVATFDKGLGDIWVGLPTIKPKEPIASAVNPNAIVYSPRSVQLAFTEPTTRGATDYVAYEWTPTHGKQELKAKALDGTVQEGTRISSFGAHGAAADEGLFLTDPVAATTQMYMASKLWGFTPGKKPMLIHDNVLTATIAGDGRVLVLTEEPHSTTSNIYLLPFASKPGK